MIIFYLEREGPMIQKSDTINVLPFLNGIKYKKVVVKYMLT